MAGNKVVLFGFLLILFTACVKEADLGPIGQPPDLLVVDAMITDEVKSHEIRLSLPVKELNEPFRPFSGAGVVISNEDSTWQLSEDSVNPGVYRTPDWFAARQQKNYTLVIARDNRVFSARASILPGKPFPELRYTRDVETGLYYIDWVANAFSTGDAAMWEVLLDWSQVPAYAPADSAATHARLLFYTLPSLDVSEIFAPLMASVQFPAGTVITERRYSLTPSHASYLRELLLETRWSGGLFPVAAASVTTNLSSGAIGWFSACGVYELSVIVQ